MGKRTTSSELEQIAKRLKYGVPNAFGKGSVKSSFSNTRSLNNLESDFTNALQGEKSLQVAYSGRPLVRITFYRHRLADHSRAISEKALVDALQYCGAICGDSQAQIRLEVQDQVKVGSKAEERTEVLIEYDEVDFDNLFVAKGRTDGR